MATPQERGLRMAPSQTPDWQERQRLLGKKTQPPESVYEASSLSGETGMEIISRREQILARLQTPSRKR